MWLPQSHCSIYTLKNKEEEHHQHLPFIKGMCDSFRKPKTENKSFSTIKNILLKKKINASPEIPFILQTHATNKSANQSASTYLIQLSWQTLLQSWKGEDQAVSRGMDITVMERAQIQWRCSTNNTRSHTGRSLKNKFQLNQPGKINPHC